MTPCPPLIWAGPLKEGPISYTKKILLIVLITAESYKLPIEPLQGKLSNTM